MVSLGDTVRWERDIGVVFLLTEFNKDLSGSKPQLSGFVATVRWQRSPLPTVHIFYANGEQGYGFPIRVLKNDDEDTGPT